MKKIIIMMLVMFSITGCHQEKRQWQETYHLTYFYLEDCSNCQYFQETVLESIEEEFGDHIVIESHDLDDPDIETLKAIYDGYINQVIDFDQADYGYGPFVVFEGYYAILGAGNSDEYVERMIQAIDGETLNEEASIETIYYLKDGKVKQGG